MAPRVRTRRELLTDVGRGMIAASVGGALAADLGLATAWADDDAPKSLSFGALDPLTKEDLVRVMTEPKNALVRQFQELFSMDNGVLEFEPDALVAIAEKALQRETGVRALRSIVEDLVLDLMYELPDDPEGSVFRVSRAAVEGREPVEKLPRRRKTGT